jgi:hypothetical protein
MSEYTLNSNSERRKVVEERLESWVENDLVRRSEARQQVARARTELQAVRGERRGQLL